MIRFYGIPTSIEGVELIDIKINSRMEEDDIFLNGDFIAEYKRKGESLFY
jgi:hypothetical protein